MSLHAKVKCSVFDFNCNLLILLFFRWSYGVTLWEICTLGGHPYPTISNKQLLQFLLQGNRLEKPHNCSDDMYVQDTSFMAKRIS